MKLGEHVCVCVCLLLHGSQRNESATSAEKQYLVLLHPKKQHTKKIEYDIIDDANYRYLWTQSVIDFRRKTVRRRRIPRRMLLVSPLQNSMGRAIGEGK